MLKKKNELVKVSVKMDFETYTAICNVLHSIQEPNMSAWIRAAIRKELDRIARRAG